VKHILILNGPNLNLLGKREPEIYGSATLEELSVGLQEIGQANGVTVTCVQSNVEGELINAIQDHGFDADAIIFNPGGYTHTSVAIRDAIAAISTPVYEVHISNPEAREEFRKISLIREVCAGGVSGFGVEGYAMVLKQLISGQ
jgi:3-dehydroquinate dehydratase-2